MADAATRVEIPAHLEAAAAAVGALIGGVVGEVAGGGGADPAAEIEVEGRFGDVVGGGFACGVTAAFMASCLQRMETFDGWTAVSAWTLTYDYFHADVRGGAVRTSRSDNGAPVHLRKTAIGERRLLLGGARGTPAAVRVGVARETPVRAADLPDAVTPTFVRRKLRRSFRVDHWAFDFTKTWGAATKAEVDRDYLDGRAPTFEIEIELVDLAGYLRLPHRDGMYAAVSLLLKICDLLPDDAPRLAVVP